MAVQASFAAVAPLSACSLFNKVAMSFTPCPLSIKAAQSILLVSANKNAMQVS